MREPMENEKVRGNRKKNMSNILEKLGKKKGS